MFLTSGKYDTVALLGHSLERRTLYVSVLFINIDIAAFYLVSIMVNVP